MGWLRRKTEVSSQSVEVQGRTNPSNKMRLSPEYSSPINYKYGPLRQKIPHDDVETSLIGDTHGPAPAGTTMSLNAAAELHLSTVAHHALARRWPALNSQDRSKLDRKLTNARTFTEV